MKTQLMEVESKSPIRHKLLSEFDPSPIFVATVGSIDVGGSRNLPFNFKSVLYQKLVMGFNSQTLRYNLRSLSFRKLSAH